MYALFYNVVSLILIIQLRSAFSVWPEDRMAPAPSPKELQNDSFITNPNQPEQQAHLQGVRHLDVNISSKEDAIDIHFVPGPDPTDQTSDPTPGSRLLEHLASYTLVTSFMDLLHQNRYSHRVIDMSNHITRKVLSYTPLYQSSDSPQGAGNFLSNSMSHFIRQHRYVSTYIDKVDILAERSLTGLDARVMSAKASIEALAEATTNYVKYPLQVSSKAKHYVFQIYGREYPKWRGNDFFATCGAIIFTILLAAFDCMVIVAEWFFETQQ